MLRLYTILYNSILISLLVLQLVARLIVGAAGHVTDYKTSDFIIIGVILTTILLLFLYSRKIIVSRILKYLNIFLVSAGALTIIYGIIKLTIDYEPVNLIIIATALLFTLLNIALIKTLIIHRHNNITLDHDKTGNTPIHTGPERQ